MILGAAFSSVAEGILLDFLALSLFLNSLRSWQQLSGYQVGICVPESVTLRFQNFSLRAFWRRRISVGLLFFSPTAAASDVGAVRGVRLYFLSQLFSIASRTAIATHNHPDTH